MKEALKLALEAMERSVATCFDQYAHQQVMSQPDHFINQAITTLRLAIDVQNMASESTYKPALAQPAQERNFCSRCGKRTADFTMIHTCTPPQDNA